MNLGSLERILDSLTEPRFRRAADLETRRARLVFRVGSSLLGILLVANASLAADRTPSASSGQAVDADAQFVDAGSRVPVKLLVEAKDRKLPLLLGSGLSGFFLREAFTRARPAADDTVFSAGASVLSIVYANHLRLGASAVRSERSILSGYLGGGSTGLDGQLAFDSAIGARWAVAPEHGPVLRIGARGWLEGNDRFYSSLLELPAIQLGYQLYQPRVLVEVAARSGVSLLGRFELDGADTRRLGEAWSWGGHTTIHFSRALLNSDWSRIQVHDGPIDVLHAQFCGALDWILVCTELERQSGQVTVEDAGRQSRRDSSVLIGGFSIGVGQHVEPRIAIAH